MFVSILQRSVLRTAQRPCEPLQSRADLAAKTPRSGGAGRTVRVNTGRQTVLEAANQAGNQVKDRYGLTEISPARGQPQVRPEAVSRGDTT
jgi:hypothetical protein